METVDLDRAQMNDVGQWFDVNQCRARALKVEQLRVRLIAQVEPFKRYIAAETYCRRTRGIDEMYLEEC